MNTFSTSVQDLSSNLSLNKLKELIEPFRDMKMLVGITCRPEFYYHLIDNIKEETGYAFFGVELYRVSSQEEDVKYFYNKKELREYLDKNI